MNILGTISQKVYFLSRMCGDRPSAISLVETSPVILQYSLPRLLRVRFAMLANAGDIQGLAKGYALSPSSAVAMADATFRARFGRYYEVSRIKRGDRA